LGVFLGIRPVSAEDVKNPIASAHLGGILDGRHDFRLKRVGSVKLARIQSGKSRVQKVGLVADSTDAQQRPFLELFHLPQACALPSIGAARRRLPTF